MHTNILTRHEILQQGGTLLRPIRTARPSCRAGRPMIVSSAWVSDSLLPQRQLEAAAARQFGNAVLDAPKCMVAMVPPRRLLTQVTRAACSSIFIWPIAGMALAAENVPQNSLYAFLGNNIGPTLTLALFVVNGYGLFNFTEKFKSLDAKFDKLDAKFDAKFDKSDAKFEKMDEKFEALESRLGKKISNLDEKFGALESRLGRKISNLDKKLTGQISRSAKQVDERVTYGNERLGVKIDAISKKLTAQNTRVALNRQALQYERARVTALEKNLERK